MNNTTFALDRYVEHPMSTSFLYEALLATSQNYSVTLDVKRVDRKIACIPTAHHCASPLKNARILPAKKT